MQGLFRLPWCSEQLKLSEKPSLEKMRPVVEIPVLHPLKRKHSDHISDASPSHRATPLLKKQRSDADPPHQLLTPSSPYFDTRFAHSPQHSLHPAHFTPAYTSANHSSGTHTQAGAPIERDPHPVKAEEEGDTKRPVAACGGYFSAKPTPPQQPIAMPAQDSQSDSLSRKDGLRQVIENSFNMQILAKHNELRLIEQELAKCQVALEQLRRCQLTPYPGSHRPELSVSDGTGPAIEPRPGFSRPRHAAPHGVTDGPYSRHYSCWLLNDRQFDSMPHGVLAHLDRSADSAKPTRNAGHSRKSASKNIGVGTRASDPMHGLADTPASAAVKAKSSFQVLRRSTDGKLVKLICKDCSRGDFSSIQGFLNHCRIAHKVDYKSHDAAAVDCGQPLDEHELAKLPPETQNVTAPKPRAAPSRSASIAIPATAKGFVHPLITSTGLPTPTRTAPPTPIAHMPVPRLGVMTPQTANNTPFKPSEQAPRLSALFAKHGFGGDLEQAMVNAQQKFDLSVDEDMLTPDTPDATSPLVSFPGGSRMFPGAKRTGPPNPGNADLYPRPPSSKGHRQLTQKPRPSPLASVPQLGDAGMHMSVLSSPEDLSCAALSPHAADSNPGLVSDHEDDDHASASDEEGSTVEVHHPSLPTVGRSCEDHMEIDVEEDDEIDQHGVIIRRNSMAIPEARGVRTMGSPSRKIGGK